MKYNEALDACSCVSPGINTPVPACMECVCYRKWEQQIAGSIISLDYPGRCPIPVALSGKQGSVPEDGMKRGRGEEI
jgi:hypothetical protein